MGVVNVTPDSFSDGGQFFNPTDAYQRAVEIATSGGDIVDLGAESSRPGSTPVTADEEWRRLEPVLRRLRDEPLGVTLSVDTYKPAVMRRACDYGVTIINDIYGGADEETLRFLADRGCTYLAMHMHGRPESMQLKPLSATQALGAVKDFYERTRTRLLECGFPEHRIWLDPGIGFGKSDAANMQLIRETLRMTDGSGNLVIGVSRKSFLGRFFGLEKPEERDPPTKMLELAFLCSGVRAIRTHDVKGLVKLKGLLASE